MSQPAAFTYETRACEGGCGYSWKSNTVDPHYVCEGCLHDWYACNDCDKSPVYCDCADCPCENDLVSNAHKLEAAHQYDD